MDKHDVIDRSEVRWDHFADLFKAPVELK